MREGGNDSETTPGMDDIEAIRTGYGGFMQQKRKAYIKR